MRYLNRQEILRLNKVGAEVGLNLDWHFDYYPISKCYKTIASEVVAELDIHDLLSCGLGDLKYFKIINTLENQGFFHGIYGSSLETLHIQGDVSRFDSVFLPNLKLLIIEGEICGRLFDPTRNGEYCGGFDNLKKQGLREIIHTDNLYVLAKN